MRKKKAAKMVETWKDREKRLQRNEKQRERHWRKTGVGDSTIQWMRKGGWL